MNRTTSIYFKQINAKYYMQKRPDLAKSTSGNIYAQTNETNSFCFAFGFLKIKTATYKPIKKYI